jgi:outer membrane protein TolC
MLQRLAAAGLCSLLVSCAGLPSLPALAPAKPAPLARSEMAPAVQADAQRMRQNVEPFDGPLTLDEALARALKYNLDRRSRILEETLAQRQLDSAALEMLPRLVADAGYTWRDNDRLTINRDASGTVTTTSVSQDRSRSLGGLEFTWSLLDLSLGYHATRQQGDRALAAGERKRKAMHLLLQDVRTAFFRALAAQKLADDVRRTVRLAEEALRDSRSAEGLRVRSPLDALRYQRQLLENLRLLEAIGHELSSAQFELAQLINAPLGQELVLSEKGSDEVGRLLLELPLARMEETVLAFNPDLREAHYNSRIAREEVRRTMARLFPNVSVNLGGQYDADSYQLNRQWAEAGVQLSFNLLNLLAGPTQVRMAEAGVALADQRRLAMQLAVLTQMHLARLALQNARDQYGRADAIFEVDRRIADMMRAREAAQAQSKLDVVGNATSATLSLLRRYQALGQMQAAENRLTATLGFDPQIGDLTELTIAQITERVRNQAQVMRQRLVESAP